MKKFNYNALLKKCQEAYDNGGASAVYDICNDVDGVEYTPCANCDAETPSHDTHPSECLVCGNYKPKTK